MEHRTSDFYTKQPCILKYCLKTPDGNNTAPEAIAVALAILNRKNVTLKPDYKVYLHGQVGVPPESDPEIDWYSWVDTSYIQEVHFERVRESGKTTYHCYVKTLNTDYLVWDDQETRMKDMKALMNHIVENNLKLEDFAEYYANINEKFPDVEIIPKTIIV